jgi:hypothetical protein
MPRTTKAQREAKQAQQAQQQAEAALAARPFAVESTDPYAGRDEAGQRAVADEIAAAKAAGASGDEMRARFGERLSGPARRKVLRAHGYGTASGHVARSYGSYRDGEPRSGTRHAREHGARAGELAAQAKQAAAEEAAEQLSLAAARKLVRASGEQPAPVRKGDASALRAQAVAVLLAQAS